MLLTVTQKLLEGFGTSCIIFIVTLLAALPLGLVIAFGSMSRFKPIAWLTRGFVWIIAFSINYAAYFSEIYRGGIESIPRGQYEAGQVLGMTKKQVFFNVILLQVVKRIVPPLGNEMMTLVKDTSLARVIACKEIIMIAQEYISVKGLIWPLFYSGLFYLLFCGALTVILGRVEKKLDYFRV